MTTTRAQIRQRIGGDGFCGDAILSSASAIGGAAGATLVDTKLLQANDYFNDYEIAITSGTALGDYRWVSDWVQSTGTFTPSRAFSAQIASGVTYELHSHNFPANGDGTSGLGKHQAINEAIRLAADRWAQRIEDETITFAATTYLYSLAPLTANPVDREWKLDKVEWDPARGTTGYEWVEIPDDWWYVRDIAGTLKLQFREGFPLPPASRAMRLTYRVRPPTLTAESGTGGVLIPDSTTFFHFACFKATELLFLNASRRAGEDKRGRWATAADVMAKQAARYIDMQTEPPPKGRIILPITRRIDPSERDITLIHLP